MSHVIRDSRSWDYYRGEVKRRSKDKEGNIFSIATIDVETASSTSPIISVIRKMADTGLRRLPVVVPSKRVLKGIVSATDIVSLIGGHKSSLITERYQGDIIKALNAPVEHIMTPFDRLKTIPPNTNIKEAVDEMVSQNVGSLLIIDEEGVLKGIVSERDFVVKLHGKHLNFKVKDYMSTQLVTCDIDDSIAEACKLMITKGYRRLPVLSKGAIIGMATAGDVISFISSGRIFNALQMGKLDEVLTLPVATIMTKNVITILPEDTIERAVDLMIDYGIGGLPVVEGETLIGILTERDILEAIVGVL